MYVYVFVSVCVEVKVEMLSAEILFKTQLQPFRYLREFFINITVCITAVLNLTKVFWTKLLFEPATSDCN